VKGDAAEDGKTVDVAEVYFPREEEESSKKEEK